MAKTAAAGYVPLLLDNAVLVCQYGGLIRIVEVPKTGTTKESGDETDDYFVIIARGNLTVRDLPLSSGQELAKLRPGSDIKVVMPKNIKHDGTRAWIEVKYDASKTGWVAEEYIHPNVQIVTDFSGSNYGQITGTVDGKSKTLNTLKNWGIAGG
jgi:hypothetical protein